VAKGRKTLVNKSPWGKGDGGKSSDPALFSHKTLLVTETSKRVHTTQTFTNFKSTTPSVDILGFAAVKRDVLGFVNTSLIEIKSHFSFYKHIIHLLFEVWKP